VNLVILVERINILTLRTQEIRDDTLRHLCVTNITTEDTLNKPVASLNLEDPLN